MSTREATKKYFLQAHQTHICRKALVSPKERQFCTAIKIKIHHAALQNKQKETFSQQDKHRQI
ncbi:CLUMA_CG000592, isoform A [Clunio marinus]|uniref:CLUMA_CG000592, isoform A n=1 Tax=Clunio marinus TaxID=568069 RepID=A0A1J1HFJ0_9DIPT|nr:CLUMA_CG000592, isoform A [Clunio marinus]